MKEINKLTVKDGLHTAIKAGLSAIPVLGSAASEVFSLVVASPLEKRRTEWMNDVAESLKKLEEAGRVDFSDLMKNEQFIDVIIHASSLAVKNSDQEKLQALRNAVMNTALEVATDKTKSQIFLNLIDQFTVWHLKVLVFINDPKKWFDKAGKKPPNLMMGSLASVLQAAYPELMKERELADLIWKDLHDAGLHRSSELSTLMSGNETLASRTTRFGKEFLSLITEGED